MRKALLTTIFSLVISILVVITASAEENNFYKNGSDFVEIEGGEFYSNIDDQDKLYYFDKTTQSHTRILDEHITTMVDVEDTIYLISYVDGKSKLLSFSTTDNSVKEMSLLNGVVNNVCIRDNILYYILDGNIYEFDLLSNDTNIIVEDGNIDLCYFKEYDSLTYFSKNSNNDYDKKHYNFSNEANQTELSEEISLFSAQSSDSISLMSTNSYTPRLTAPSTTDPYYTTLNVFHTSGYGMVGNNGNCTCYAYGRSYENLGYKPSLSTGNAGGWYSYNVNNGYYSYGQTPYLGAVAVWTKPGAAGHVAVVEVIDGDTVTTSESGWNSFYFKTVTRSASNSNFSASSSYNFQGFIYVMGYLTTKAPTSATLSMDKEWYEGGETFTLNFSSNTTCQYYLSIFDYDTGEAIIQTTVNGSTYSNSFQKAGHYNAYMTAFNDKGGVNSNWVDFYIYVEAPTYANVSMDKEWYEGGETFTLSFSSNTTCQYYLSIFDYDTGEAIIQTTVNGSTYSNSFQKAGHYNAYMTAFNDKGGVNSNWVDFYIYVGGPSSASISLSKTELSPGESIVFTNNHNAYYAWTYMTIYNEDTKTIVDEGWKPSTYTFKPPTNAVYKALMSAYTPASTAHAESVFFYVGKYTVSYNANSGSGEPSSQAKIHGKNLSLSTTKPTKSGYTFKNWNTKADGSGTTYASGAIYTINEGITLYAQWKKTTPYTQIKKVDNGNYSVELFNLDNGCTVIFATYQNDRLVEFYPATYDGNKIPFTTTKQFDTIKVMVWDNLNTIKPLCEANSTIIE